MLHCKRIADCTGWASGGYRLLPQYADTGAQAPSGAADALRKLADEYFDQVYFHYAPSTGTLDGFHQYDAQLEDYSRAAVDRETADLQRFEARFAAIPADQLDLTSQGDLELLLANIHSTLLWLNTIRLWEKDPDQYSSGISNSAFVLMERNFASPDDRLRSLVAREKLMPAALDAAHQNLKNPPQIYTEIALEQLPDIITFFQSDVPTAFKQAQNEQLKERIFTVEQRRHHGSQELPELAQEGRSSPLAWRLPVWRGDLLEAAALRRDGGHAATQAACRSAMRTCTRTRRSSTASPTKSNPTGHRAKCWRNWAATILRPIICCRVFSDTFQGLIQFIQEKHIVDIPSPVRPTLENTPPFMRATTTASMDTPGPFEKVSTQAYFNVTVPDAARYSATDRRAHGRVQPGNHHQHCDS